MDKKEMYFQSLGSISPVDGRESPFTQELKVYLSEGALHRYRAVVEIENLIALAESDFPVAINISDQDKQKLRSIYDSANFDASAPAEYDHFERKGKGPLEHDVKSVEVYLRERLEDEGLSHLNEFLHFPMTSEDVNNIAYNLMIKNALNKVVIPKVVEVSDKLAKLAQEHADTPCIGKTHGMNASPTTYGKRFAYYLDKFVSSLESLQKMRLKAKFAGPVGNHNAMKLVLPDFDMRAYSQKLVESFGFEYAEMENQRISHQEILRILAEISLINVNNQDICENIRHGVMMNWLYQEGEQTHVGSSVMPHKINPWFFEVGQAYAEMSNRLIDGAKDGLIISVFERDLTDHPWERAYGSMLGYALTALGYVSMGLDTIRVDKEKCLADLQSAPEVMSEAVQIAGRVLQVDDAYMKIKKLTRGKKIDRNTYEEMVETIIEDDEYKKRLLAATPDTYLGFAKELAEETVSNFRSVESHFRKGMFDEVSHLEAVLFDFDGTLQLGDKDELFARLKGISDQLKMNFSEEDIQAIGDRSDYREMRKLMVERFNQENPDAQITEDDFTAVNNKVSGTFDDKFYLAAGALELLVYLKETGYKLALVTTRGSNSLPRLLKHHQIADYFDVIINRDDCKQRKPHPQPIAVALEKLGVKGERAMYVGDKQVDDVIAGNALGMTTVLVGESELDSYGAQPNYKFAAPMQLLELFRRSQI